MDLDLKKVNNFGIYIIIDLGKKQKIYKYYEINIYI